ncbi:MAG: SulP family inorganic anion transporter, partial [Spirochaetia bacterium]
MNSLYDLRRKLPSLGGLMSQALNLERYSQRAPLQDALGGLTAAIVSLPMALAFGTVSGLGAEAGLYGAIIVGLTAAVFGGTRVLISEPTGPMTVMMTAIVAHGVAMDPARGAELAFVVVILAGVFQIVFGKLRLGRYITMMPYGVISGFMSGIGVLLVVQQFPGMLGLSDVQALIETFRSFTQDFTVADHLEAAVGIGVFVVLVAYPKSLRRYLPPQLLALLLGLAASILITAAAGPTYGLQTIGAMEIGFPRPHVPAVSFEILGTLLVDAVLLGLLGSIDTLLTATISDNLSSTHHDSDRELVGQGIANFLSGLFGGLPGAGATMGTVVTIQTGARSPLAGIVRTVVLIASVAVFSPVIALIPLAVLSAIAVKVGIDILDWSFLGRAHHISRSTTVIMYLVLGLTVFVDLI